MNKQEAIQLQIDDIMDSFDFRAVAEYMKSTDWKWGLGAGEHVPDEWELRKTARERLRRCESTGSGGFSVTYEEGVEGGNSWLRLNLSFHIDQSLNDGTFYD